MGDTTRAVEYMELFSEQEKYPYWYIENVSQFPEFQEILREIELRFWKYHKELRDSLKQKNLL